MLPQSVRRVVSAAAPQSPLLSGFASTATRATTGLTLSYSPRASQRRRYSSSKPSSPNDSSKGLPAGQVTASPSQSSKASGEKKRRKAKDSGNATALPNLPSVPSTHHVPHEALALSTFFSLHRPMSVTQSFPKTVTDDAFAQIFALRIKNNQPADVISTLSRTVDELEQPMQSLALDSQHEAESGDGAHEPVKIDVKNADGSESSVYLQLNAMSGKFLPFRPPPIPQPEAQTSTSSAETGAAEEAVDASTQPQRRVYKAVFTLEETTTEKGDVQIVAHSPTLLEEDAVVARTFLERMALRQMRRQHGGIRASNNGMLAISVKRIRKLRMKKKKYKKLMKRTRTERRKLDRI